MALAVAAESTAVDLLQVLPMRFELLSDRPIRLAAYPGSQLRGILGHALQALACHPECSPAQQCSYHYLFEAIGEDRGEEVPRPYILQPPDVGRVLPGGQRLSLGVVLVGRGADHWANVVHAVQEMGRMGLGERRDRFRLDRVSALSPTGWHVFWSGSSWTPPTSIPLGLLTPTHVSDSIVQLEFLTPCRLVHRGELVKVPPFHVLVRALLRRLDGLLRHHGDAELQVDYKGLIEKAQAVETVSTDLRWFDWERHSNRQQRSMRLGGFVGPITYRGDLQPFAPLLAAGTVVHVGKATTFGLGQYRIVQESPW